MGYIMLMLRKETNQLKTKRTIASAIQQPTEPRLTTPACSSAVGIGFQVDFKMKTQGVHTCDPSTRETEREDYCRLRPAWMTERDPGSR